MSLSNVPAIFDAAEELEMLWFERIAASAYIYDSKGKGSGTPGPYVAFTK